MGKESNFFYRWYLAIVPNGVWDLIKFVGGSSLISGLWKALVSELQGNPVDWFLVAVYVAVGIILLVVAGRQQQPIPASPYEEAKKNPPKATIDFAGEYQKADYIAAHGKGHRCVQVFDELQITCIETSRELRDFLVNLGPCPEVDTNIERAVVDVIKDHLILAEPWYQKLVNGYKLRFESKVLTLKYQLGEKEIEYSSLNKYADGVSHQEHLLEIARDLTKAVSLLENDAWEKYWAD